LIVIKNSVVFVNCIELTVFWQTDGNNTSLLQTALTKAYGRTSLMSPSLDSAAVIATLILSLHLGQVSKDVHTVALFTLTCHVFEFTLNVARILY